MKRTRFYFSGISLCCILMMAAGCKPAAQSKSNMPATLTFGQGGGVTGKYKEYSLVIDGKLFNVDPMSGQKTYLKKIHKTDCRSLFIEAERLGLLKMDFNHPFNINYYIIYRKGTASKKINWGDANNPPPAGVKELWDKLWALTK
jgi:hypothetical protein